MNLRLVGGGKGYCQIGLRSLGIRRFGYVGAWKWIGAWYLKLKEPCKGGTPA